MNAKPLLLRVGVWIVALLLVAACGKTATQTTTTTDQNAPPTITGRQYLFSSHDSQNSSSLAVTINDTAIVGKNTSDSTKVTWGTVSALSNGFLQLSLTHTTDPQETVPHTLYAIELKNGFLAVVDTGKYISGIGAYESGDVGLDNSGTGSCGTVANNSAVSWVQIPDSSFDQTQDGGWGTAKFTTDTTVGLDLAVSSYNVSADLTGTPTSLPPFTSLVCKGSTMSNGTVSLAFTGAGFAMFTDPTSSTNVIAMPQPASAISSTAFAAEGREYTGFADFLYTDPSNTNNTTTVKIVARAIAQADSSLLGAPILDIPSNTPFVSTPAKFTIGQSTGAPNGLFDTSTMNDGSGVQHFPFMVQQAPTGEYVIVGLMGGKAGGTAKEWSFVVLVEKPTGGTYPRSFALNSPYKFTIFDNSQSQQPQELQVSTTDGKFVLNDPNLPFKMTGSVTQLPSGFLKLAPTYTSNPAQTLGDSLYGLMIPGAVLLGVDAGSFSTQADAFLTSHGGPDTTGSCSNVKNGDQYNAIVTSFSTFDPATSTAWATGTFVTSATAGAFDLVAQPYLITETLQTTSPAQPQTTFSGLACDTTQNALVNTAGDKVFFSSAGSAILKLGQASGGGGAIMFPTKTSAAVTATNIHASGNSYIGIDQRGWADPSNPTAVPQDVTNFVRGSADGSKVNGSLFDVLTGTNVAGQTGTLVFSPSTGSVPARDGIFDNSQLTDTNGGIKGMRMMAVQHPVTGKIVVAGYILPATTGGSDWEFVLLYQQ